MKPKITGYAGGVFDLFHIGHLNIIEKSRALCDELIVAVTTDEYTYKRKGKYPIVPYEERVRIISSIRCVDRVVPQDIDSLDDYVAYMLDLQGKLGFTRIFKGSDAEGAEKWIRLEAEMKKRGVEVIFFPYTITTSSTLIREKLGNY